jgi:phytoene dehydrogenase-like protein
VPWARRYIIPGGSAGAFDRQGCTFDVGSSMMFGFGEHGTTNLITRALAAVGKKMETFPDPTQIHYHLPASANHPEVCVRAFECARALACMQRWPLHLHTKQLLVLA